jgi:hypothetical protein
MAASPSLLAWSGTARLGRVRIQAPEGHDLTFTTLSGLAAHLLQRQDPWGGMVCCAAGLGIALHGIQRLGGMAADLDTVLDEADALLHGLPVHGVLARMAACIEKHRDILTPREGAARLVLEAKRVQREHTEAVALATVSARSLVPATGDVLLAWPGGPACDLGEGLLTGLLVATRRRGGPGTDIRVAGPEALAGDAVSYLTANGLGATVVSATAAHDIARNAPLSCVLTRCIGNLAEPVAAELAALAAARGVPVVGLGVPGAAEPDGTSLAPLPSGCSTRRVEL